MGDWLLLDQAELAPNRLTPFRNHVHGAPRGGKLITSPTKGYTAREPTITGHALSMPMANAARDDGNGELYTNGNRLE